MLDTDQSVFPFVQRLVERHPGRVAVGCLAQSTESGSVVTSQLNLEAARLYPVTNTTDTLVLVVDESVGLAASNVLGGFDAETGEEKDGPMLMGSNPEPLVAYSRAVAACLWDELAEWRRMCETTGWRVILVTTDLRTSFGPLRSSDFFRSGRVRSHIGDAGRYHCHCRYLVQNRRGVPRDVVLLKDEAEGLMGRVIFRDGH